MNNYKQIIRVPERVEGSFFALPSVIGVTKNERHGLHYEVEALTVSGGNTRLAYPGDYLCERQDGKWVLVYRDIDVEIRKLEQLINKRQAV